MRAGDVIYTNTPTYGADAPLPNLQLFWEAFPSGSGPSDRTTYMFTYLDADPSRYGRHLLPVHIYDVIIIIYIYNRYNGSLV